MEMKKIMNSIMGRKTNQQLTKELENKLDEIPELRDVIEQVVILQIDSTKQIRVEITVKDFDKSTNTTFEKIIKR